MDKVRTVVLWLTFILVMGVVNFKVWGKEQLAQNGRVVLLELGVRDPRSLIQGDYMTLNYELERELRDVPHKAKVIIVSLDEHDVATFGRYYDEGVLLAENEQLLRIHAQSRWEVSVGADSFFFQEGEAELYETARYAEYRVSEEGEMVLVGLRDEEFGVLGDR